jgi:hypothetical protein
MNVSVKRSMKTKRKNPQAKELTYDQVESRKDRGVEGLRRMGADENADKLDDESVEDFAERKKITIVNPRKKSTKTFQRRRRCKVCKGMTHPAAMRKSGICGACEDNPPPAPRGRRRNGEIEDAQKMFQKFHGRRPTTIEEVQQRQQYRQTMSGLGVLMFLRTDLTQEWNGKGVGLTFSEEDKVIVASDPAGNQIYFLGGNQDVTGILPRNYVDGRKDFIDLGACDCIIYTADKDFDNFEEKDYQHEFAEEGEKYDLEKTWRRLRPRLMFDQLNQQLYLIGGAYEVKREGIVN